LNPNHYNIDELILLCKQKNQKAQGEIYNRYVKSMYNVSFRIVKDTHFAEDVTQEGFLKAFTKINDYKQEVAFGAWLKRIVVNCSIDFYKKNNRFKSEDFESAVYKIEEATADVTESNSFNELKIKQILESIKALKYNYRMVLTLFYIEGYDSQEISEILILAMQIVEQH
jgi:RNA polymerase sigma-70 factor (ECF subfamily)